MEKLVKLFPETWHKVQRWTNEPVKYSCIRDEDWVSSHLCGRHVMRTGPIVLVAAMAGVTAVTGARGHILLQLLRDCWLHLGPELVTADRYIIIRWIDRRIVFVTFCTDWTSSPPWIKKSYPHPAAVGSLPSHLPNQTNFPQFQVVIIFLWQISPAKQSAK